MFYRRKSRGGPVPASKGPRLGRTLAVICGIPGLLAVLGVGGPALMMPAAASLEVTPRWQVAWETLTYEDRCPTPRDGYCEATLSRQRLCLGPLELRYSYSN